MPDSIKDAMNRGNNLAMMIFLSVLSIGVFAELFLEPEFIDKADDAVIIILGIIGVIWYFRGRNRYQASWTPFVLIALVLVDKVGALINEFSDPASVGDEYGIVPLAAAMLIISAILVIHAKRESREMAGGRLTPSAIPQTGAGKDDLP